MKAFQVTVVQETGEVLQSAIKPRQNRITRIYIIEMIEAGV